MIIFCFISKITYVFGTYTAAPIAPTPPAIKWSEQRLAPVFTASFYQVFNVRCFRFFYLLPFIVFGALSVVFGASGFVGSSVGVSVVLGSFCFLEEV